MKEQLSSAQSIVAVPLLPADRRGAVEEMKTRGCISALLRERHERLLCSAQFARSERLSVLLTYLLQAVESSSTKILDERTIGIEVFGRTPNWDPTIDPCVRVAMGRLRKRLEEYYASVGRNDEVRVILPKGSYLPQVIARTHRIQETVPVQIHSKTKSHRNTSRRVQAVWFACGTLLLLLCLIMLSERRFNRGRAVTYKLVPFSTELGVQFSPAISPDGRNMAYVWDGNQNDFGIYVRSIEGGTAVRLGGGNGNDLYPSWSPDGSRLAFLRTAGWEGKLIIAPVHGGNEQVVATIATAPGRWTDDNGPLLGNPGPIWSHDGTELIAFDQGHFGIYSISIATGARRQLTSDTQTSRDFYPQLSPDGKTLAYVHYVSHGVGDVYVLSMEHIAAPKQVTHDQATIRGLSWSPDGRTLLLASNRTGPFELWRVDLRTLALESVPADTSQASSPAMSPDGQWFAYDNSYENTNIKQAEIPEKDGLIQLRTVVSSLGRNAGAALSRDGNRLLFVSDRSGTWQIWQSTPDGTAPQMLTHIMSSLIGSISWSPDSRHIVYDARPAGHSSIFLLDVDTGQTRRLSRSDAEERVPSWSRDGRYVYFSSDQGGNVALYRMDTASGSTTLMASGGFRSQSTEDGRWLYFATLYGVLWRVPQTGGEAIQMPESIQPYSSTTWTVVRNQLLVLKKSPRKNTFALLTMDEDLRSKRLGEVETARNCDLFQLSVSASGHTFFITSRDQIASDIVLYRKTAR